MNVFDIIGPVMIGPSSSHTAGAVRLGRVAYKLLGTFLRRQYFLSKKPGRLGNSPAARPFRISYLVSCP